MDNIEEALDVGGFEPGIHVGEAVAELGEGLIAHQAACHHQPCIRVVPFQWLEGAQVADGSILSTLPHHAGVEDHQVRVLRSIHSPVAQLHQLLGGGPRIGSIHLTADNPYVEGEHGASQLRRRIARATTKPEAADCTSPRVTPAPSPAAKRFSTCASSSSVSSSREE